MNEMNINEVDSLLNEREISLKKKIFSLGKMETLVFSDPKLTEIYNDMSINGEERYGYHYNETIMNIIFNDYILNSPKFLQKYKMAIPKEKKRRDKSGINKMKNDAIEKEADKAGKKATEIDETTGSASSGAYAGPSAWSPNGDLLGNSSLSPVRKPIFPNGTVIQENYLAEADYFVNMYKQLNEEQDFTLYNNLNKDYVASHTGSNKGIGVSELPASKETNQKIKNIDDNSPLYVGQDIARMKPKDVDLLHNDMTQLHSYFPHPENKNLKDDGISGTQNEDINRKSEISTIDADTDAYGNEVKNMSNSDLNVIDDQMKTHKWDSANISGNIDEKSVSKAQQRFMGVVRGIQKGTIDPSKAGASAEKAAETMKPKDVKDFAATKTGKLPEKVSEVTMIETNPESMSTKQPIGTEGSGIERGMNDNSTPMSEGGTIQSDPRVQKLVDIVNQLIKMAVDSDNSPIGVVDSQGTWQEPYVYSPIEYRNGQLKITSHSIYNSNNPTVEVILKRNMEYDGIPTLRELAKEYRLAIKKYQRDSQKNIDKYNDDMNESKIFTEINDELKQLSDLQSNLKNISEDKRTPSMINVDRMGTDNAKNFKQDMQHSGTKEIIDVEKELQYKDQQTDIKDPKKLSSSIEKEELKKAKGTSLENVGNSANEKGNEIPKRNLSTDEQDEVDSYRLGLGDLDYSITPDKKFEDRMKTDMGDKNYAMRLKKLDMRHNQPMYNKDTQPTATAKMNETFISGKYYDDFGKSHIIDFILNEANEVKKVDDNWFRLNLNGLGNTYTNKLDSDTHKIGVNEGVADLIVSYDYYVDANKKIFVIAVDKMLSENTNKKAVSNESLDKMRHLFEYKTSDFVDMRNNTRI